MNPFGKDFYRALTLGFLIGCAGMALGTTGFVSRAVAATAPVVGVIAHSHR